MMRRATALAALLGPLVFFLNGWLEATLGYAQGYGLDRSFPDDPLRVLVDIQLTTAGLFCLALTLKGCQARMNERDRWVSLAGRLSSGAAGLFVVSSVLWWPIIGLGVSVEWGPLPVAFSMLAMLCLFGAWIMLGVRALRAASVPRWSSPVPLALFVLMLPLYFVYGVRGPWPIISALFVPFAAGWVALGFAAWSGARVGESLAPEAAPARAS